MANLYDKAGLVNIPVGYQDGFLYNIKPEDNTLGFRFNRDSAATRVNKEGLIEQVGYFGPELVQNGDFSQLGPELVVNGDFATDSDWTKGTGWSIANGTATIDGTQTSGSNLFSSVMSVTSGKIYKIVVNVISASSGLRLYANGVVLEFNLSVGENVFYETVSSSTYQVALLGLSGTTGSIDNVSVKQVDPNDYWNLGTGWVIENGAATCTELNNNLTQDVGVSAGKSYKVTLDVIEYTSGTLALDIGGSSNQTTSSVGSKTFHFQTSSTGNLRFYGGSFRGSIDNVSVVEVLGDKPRIDYTDSLTSPSFLLEPQSTNLYPFSQNVNPNGLIEYVSGSATLSLTNNYSISPDGTKNALRFQGTVTNNSSDRAVLRDLISTLAVISTVSVYAKSNTDKNYTMAFHYTGGNKTTFTVTPEWQRFSYSENSTTSNFAGVELRGTFTSLEADVSLWGFQFENQSYATSVIPTSGSTVTRTQETCVNAGNASTFNSAEGVLYAEIAALADDETHRYISLSDGTNKNRIIIRYVAGGSNFLGMFARIGNVTEVSQSINTDITVNAKVALKYKLNDYALWVNGVKVKVDTNALVPSAGTLNKLSFASGDQTTSLFHGKTKGVYVFNEALTDDELQQLTGPEYNSFAALAAAYNYTVI